MLDTIYKRRSIRKFSPLDVEPEIVEQIIRCGMQAPSAGNAQPWQFIVVRDKELLNAIAEFHPYAKMIRQVSVAVVVCGDTSKEVFSGYWVQDCSACVQNMLLATESIKGDNNMELGSVWVGIYPPDERIEKVQQLLSLPKEVIPLAVLPIGYKGEKKEIVDRFNPERIHYNKW